MLQECSKAWLSEQGLHSLLSRPGSFAASCGRLDFSKQASW